MGAGFITGHLFNFLKNGKMRNLMNKLKMKVRFYLKEKLHIHIVEERIAADYLQLEELQRNYQDLEDKFYRLEEKLNDYEYEFDKMENNYNDLDSRVDDLEEFQYGMDDALSSKADVETLMTNSDIRDIVHEELENMPKESVNIASEISTEDQLSTERLITGIVRSEIATYNQYLLECTQVMSDHLESKSFD